MKKRIRNALLTIIMVLSIATTCIIPTFDIFSITSLTANAVDNAQEDSMVDPYVDIFDFNCDKMINMTDVVVLSRILAEDFSVIDSKFEFLDPDGDGLLTATDAVLLLLYLAENSTPQVNPNTTETTTSTTETTTTETTTSTTVTTTTMTETTSTSSLSETTSVTTSESSVISPAQSLRYDIFEKISVKDTVAPAYNEDLYELSDRIYLFKVGDVTYAYTLLAENEEKAADCNLSNILLIKGLHIWIYEGSEIPYSVEDSLPNTDGLTFHCVDPVVPNQTEFAYRLYPYNEIDSFAIDTVSSLIAKNREQSVADISHYDYNLNGVVDVDDLEIMTRYYASNPYNLFGKLNEKAFMRYINNLPELGHTNVILHTTTSTIPQEFAFNIPTADIEGVGSSDAEIPVQILPSNYDMSGYDYEELDEEADFYAWIPQWDLWTYVSLNSEYWSFKAGYYVYILDYNGKYVTELIK